jgi:hypothetical protein
MSIGNGDQRHMVSDKENIMHVGGVVHMVEHLSSKCETLNSNPSITKRKEIQEYISFIFTKLPISSMMEEVWYNQ